MCLFHVRFNDETPVTVPSLKVSDQPLITNYIGMMKKTRSRDHWVREPLIHRVCEEPEDPGSYPSWGLSLDLVSLRSLVKMGQHGDHCCPALLLDSLHIHTTASRLRQGQGTFSMAHSAGRVSDNLHPRVHRLTHHSQVPVHDRAIHNSLNGQNLKTKKIFSNYILKG